MMVTDFTTPVEFTTNTYKRTGYFCFEDTGKGVEMSATYSNLVAAFSPLVSLRNWCLI